MTFRALLVVLALSAASPVVAAGPDPATPQESRLSLNEAYVGAIRHQAPIDPDDALSVFSFVFAGLADEVTVLPTENYYYFTFFHDGVEWAGNIRLDVIDRDKGAVHFAYFERTAPWIGDGISRYRLMVPADGVTLTRAAPLVYDLSFKGRTVRFRLNDRSGVRPPDHSVREDEVYLGPVFDESGLELFLMFDETRKAFLYVLDESRPVADKLVPLAAAPDILIGRRTGFAFYRDARAGRKVLVGVHASSIAENNYLDGPFDQLPDNFIDRKVFRKALEAAYPEVRGQIDDYGNFAGGEGRVLINPYRAYTLPAELASISECAAKAADDEAYYACLAPEP
jgi:hypothetical protein